MQTFDLNEENQKLFFLCLEDWSDEMKEAGNHKEIWYEKMKAKGLRVKLTADDAGAIGGMIQYLPIEHSVAAGRDLYFVLCIWVHGHRRGRGNFQKKGMGQALLQAAEQDARSRGAKGMAAWGIVLPFFMRASWFKKQGYRRADREGMQVLLWKPFAGEAEPPRWIRQRKKPGLIPGKVSVTALLSGWCPAQNLTFERARRAAAEFGERVEFRTIDTGERDVFLEWGISDALFIEGRPLRTGPPPAYEKVRKIIARRVRKLPAETARI